ncbi:MAG TPA: RpiB/LacA/LacB family sugar-phosphate isomerase [Spirochaetia bacterium]|nr:RpiB/LacA/LacB family sugar-phosphate isomerase [Spirochaetia bacterium]
MTVAIINETSAADRNEDILKALDGRGHRLINCGMRRNGEEPQLSYIQTGFLSALLLNLQRVDFVVGGCGTGQGFLNAVVLYPNVVCGHIVTPLDAWLFTRINGGNCVSLMLNQGYGWGSDVNLRLIFDHLFGDARGEGFPEHRKSAQQHSAALLAKLSLGTHRTMAQIVAEIPDEVAVPVFTYPGVKDLVLDGQFADRELGRSLESRISAASAGADLRAATEERK